MNDWYMSLPQRERNLVNAAGILLVFAAFYMGIWSPLHGKIDSLNSAINTAQNDLIWMQEKAQEVKAYSRSASANGVNKRGKMSLNQAVSSTASRFQVTLDEISSAGQDSVSVRIREVQYENVTKWLFELERSYQTKITSISITQTEESGMVTVRMKLEDQASS